MTLTIPILIRVLLAAASLLALVAVPTLRSPDVATGATADPTAGSSAAGDGASWTRDAVPPTPVPGPHAVAADEHHLDDRRASLAAEVPDGPPVGSAIGGRASSVRASGGRVRPTTGAPEAVRTGPSSTGSAPDAPTPGSDAGERPDPDAERSGGRPTAPRRSGDDAVIGALDHDGATVVPPFEPAPFGLAAPPPAGRAAGLGAGDGFKAGPGCAVQCITDGVAYARGVGAELVLETDTPARLWLIVWDDDGYHALRYGGDAPRTSFSSLFDDLDQGRTYHALGVAQDTAGFQAQRYGTFHTHRRHARLEFGGVTVTSHPYDGAFDYHYALDGAWLPSFGETHWPYPHHHPLAGSKVVVLAAADEHVRPAVMAVQRRKDTGKQICEGTDFPEGVNVTGHQNCEAWVTASDGSDLGIELDGSPSGNGPAVDRSFVVTLTGNNGKGMSLEAIVVIEVWYAE
jgi:hypothetical protein